MRIALCTCLVFLSLLASAKSGSNSPSQPAQTDSAEYGEQAYKSNCTRCHTAPPALSQRQANTVMRHMRVKANLPARDAQAIYQYLLQSDKKH
jgi:cytochrome c5